MPEPFQELAGLDRLVHEPARLAILTSLGACSSADFLFLQRLTGLSKGNLSSHLAKLEEAGLVVVTKRFVGRKPTTTVALADAGRSAVERHWQELERLRGQALAWRADDQPADDQATGDAPPGARGPAGRRGARA